MHKIHSSALILSFESIGLKDLADVGGKNASLGEMIQHLSKLGIRVPGGFATTASAYQAFIGQSGLIDKINQALDTLDVDDLQALRRVCGQIRADIEATPFQPAFIEAVTQYYAALGDNCAVAVRSSATAEDLPNASFAGQQETFLNIQGIDAVLVHIKQVYASLFNDRAVAYRVHKGFPHANISLSVGIQRMVRSDLAASGVLFTLDTESGFDGVVFITSSYGLGEMVVQGSVNPDEYYVYKNTLAAGKPAVLRKSLGTKQQKMVYAHGGEKSVEIVPVLPAAQKQFSITDAEAEQLARYAMIIEKHYGCPMDIEWGKDGQDQQLYILQARPETVQSQEDARVISRYQMKQTGKVLVEGRSIGQKVGQGRVVVINSIAQMDDVQIGDVLVTDMTDPDWEPIMKRASGIVTNRGGRTCHAAIIARELGIPAIVGCGDATEKLTSGMEVTVSCAEGDVGYVYAGILDFDIQKIYLDQMPVIPCDIMMNVGNPDRAFSFSRLPNSGVGLARLEFIISQMIGIHPQACLQIDALPTALKEQILERTVAYGSPRDYYVKKLVEGIATIAGAFSPKKVIIRMSDFKSNEYANLLGGRQFEPTEENPMLGFRGASRYIDPKFEACFALECEAIKQVREVMGFDNVEIMIPFVRTFAEAEGVLQVLKRNELERGKDGLRIIMMCELPTNALLAEEYLEYFDGFSIGSNDLTQLTLGLDRDSGIIAKGFDERDPAVKKLLAMAIRTCNAKGKYVGICGQGPSDHPDFAQWLIAEGIQSVSLNPDSVLETWLYLAKNP